jgi:hypothetical protein
MKRHHLFALFGVSFVLHANAQTPPPPVSGGTPPAVAEAPAHPATEQSNANPFKPKDVPLPSAQGVASQNQPPLPMPMQPVTGPNGESPKKLGSLNGVTAYRGTDASYQFIQGPNQ